MTLADALRVAKQQLDQNGRLLNSHLLKLVDGDEALCREVRESLIFDGLAVDRNGVGLARAVPLEEPPPHSPSQGLPKSTPTLPPIPPEAPSSPPLESPVSTAVEAPIQTVIKAPPAVAVEGWWWMADGQTLGPADNETIEAMWQRGELLPIDMVRRGIRGMWQKPEEVLQPLTNPMPAIRARVAIEKPPPPPRRPVEESIFYFWESGRSTGPVTRTELLERLNEGRLKRDEFVQVGEGGEWQPISTLINEPESATEPLPTPSKAEEPAPRKPVVAREPTEPAIERKPKKPVAPVVEPPQPKRVSKQTAAPAKPSRLPSAATIVEEPKAKSRFSSAILGVAWQRAVELAGSEKRLYGWLTAVAVVIGGYVWWIQPPSANSVYREFADCYARVKELRSRPGVELAELTRATNRSRARVESLITGLRNPRSGASSRQPAKQELLWTGENELLKLLGSTKLDQRMELELERQFETRMAEARRLIDGGTARPQAPSPVMVEKMTAKTTTDLMTGETRPSLMQAAPTSPDSNENGQGTER